MKTGAGDDDGNNSSDAVPQQLDKLLERMERFAKQLHESKSTVRRRTVRWELESCLDDVRDLLLQWLDPSQRSVVMEALGEATGATRAARLEVWLTADRNNHIICNKEEPGSDDEPPASPKLSEGSTPSSQKGYWKKVDAVCTAYAAVKGILDGKSQRMIERAVWTLQTAREAAEKNAAAVEPPKEQPRQEQEGPPRQAPQSGTLQNEEQQEVPHLLDKPGRREHQHGEERTVEEVTVDEPQDRGSEAVIEEAMTIEAAESKVQPQMPTRCPVPASQNGGAPCTKPAIKAKANALTSSPPSLARAATSPPSIPRPTTTKRVTKAVAPSITASHGFRGRTLASRIVLEEEEEQQEEEGT